MVDATSPSIFRALLLCTSFLHATGEEYARNTIRRRASESGVEPTVAPSQPPSLFPSILPTWELSASPSADQSGSPTISDSLEDTISTSNDEVDEEEIIPWPGSGLDASWSGTIAFVRMHDNVTCDDPEDHEVMMEWADGIMTSLYGAQEHIYFYDYSRRRLRETEENRELNFLCTEIFCKVNPQLCILIGCRGFGIISTPPPTEPMNLEEAALMAMSKADAVFRMGKFGLNLPPESTCDPDGISFVIYLD